MTDNSDVAEQFEKHLNSPKQTWLLGAGISFAANVPLMHPLTKRVMAVARESVFQDDAVALSILDFIQGDVAAGSHIEEYLTHLGDCISMAERSRTAGITVNNAHVPKAKLVEVHLKLLGVIADTVRWGYRSGVQNEDGEEIEAEEIGAFGNSIVRIDDHRNFVAAVFGSNRAGVEYLRTPVEFFTTNYDTLLEDALGLERIGYKDGFTGGGVGFWGAQGYEPDNQTRAIITKLHGSTDWYRASVAPSPVLRVRDGDPYPSRGGGAVMIYPQATKYLNTQRDPFAELFQRFRHRLAVGVDHVLLICGYSFGDEHINAEIEQAMAAGKSQLTIVAFADEPDGQFSGSLRTWCASMSWRERVFVASPRGLYQGDSGPHFPAAAGSRDWWTFAGATRLFSEGLPADVQGAIQ